MAGDRNFREIPFEELRVLAARLEEALTRVNKKLVEVAGIEEGGVVPTFTQAAATLLRLDEFGKRRLEEAVEEARIVSLAGDGIVLAAVLVSAVALTHFRRSPKPLTGLLGRSPWAQKALRAITGTPPAIPALALGLLYAVAGRQAVKKLRERRQRPPTLDV